MPCKARAGSQHRAGIKSCRSSARTSNRPAGHPEHRTHEGKPCQKVFYPARAPASQQPAGCAGGRAGGQAQQAQQAQQAEQQARLGPLPLGTGQTACAPRASGGGCRAAPAKGAGRGKAEPGKRSPGRSCAEQLSLKRWFCCLWMDLTAVAMSRKPFGGLGGQAAVRGRGMRAAVEQVQRWQAQVTCSAQQQSEQPSRRHMCPDLRDGRALGRGREAWSARPGQRATHMDAMQRGGSPQDDGSFICSPSTASTPGTSTPCTAGRTLGRGAGCRWLHAHQTAEGRVRAEGSRRGGVAVG